MCPCVVGHIALCVAVCVSFVLFLSFVSSKNGLGNNCLLLCFWGPSTEHNSGNRIKKSYLCARWSHKTYANNRAFSVLSTCWPSDITYMCVPKYSRIIFSASCILFLGVPCTNPSSLVYIYQMVLPASLIHQHSPIHHFHLSAFSPYKPMQYTLAI